MKEIRKTTHFYFTLSYKNENSFHFYLTDLFIKFNYIFIEKIRDNLNYDLNILGEIENIIQGINYDTTV